MSNKRSIKKSDLALGRNIEKLRLLKNLSRRELGRKINKNEQQILKYETGHDFVPLPIIEKIAVALDQPVNKKIIRRISFVRKTESEENVQLDDELINLYDEAFCIDEDDHL
jgi:transcriptional regulator with XRE-family HTH domain